MWWTLVRLLMILVAVRAYHQSDYGAKLHIVECSNYNKSYLKDVHIGLNFFNRSTRVLNVKFNLLKKLADSLRTSVQVYKFLSNEYRFFPITFSADGCKDIENDAFGMKQAFQKSANFEIRCPFTKGLHIITNIQIDFSKYPPFIPGGDYKVEIKLHQNDYFVFEIDAYIIVTELIKKWEN